MTDTCEECGSDNLIFDPLDSGNMYCGVCGTTDDVYAEDDNGKKCYPKLLSQLGD